MSLYLDHSFAQELLLPFSARDAANVVEIQQVINLFALAVDQHRYDLFPQVFTPDVTVNFNTPGIPIIHGLDALTQHIPGALQNLPSFHAQSTPYVNFSNTAGPTRRHITRRLSLALRKVRSIRVGEGT